MWSLFSRTRPKQDPAIGGTYSLHYLKGLGAAVSRAMPVFMTFSSTAMGLQWVGLWDQVGLCSVWVTGTGSTVNMNISELTGQVELAGHTVVGWSGL